LSTIMDHDSPSEASIRDQLERILASADFCRSDRLSGFLQFIVDERLEGRGDRLKAYTIALAVFDRPSSFDPQSDPLVRIEATRLRRALERYYLTDGKLDPLVISVPKGAYVPHVAPRAGEPGGEAGAVMSGEDDHAVARLLPQAAQPRWRTSAPGGVLAALACAVLGLVLVFHTIQSPMDNHRNNAPLATAVPALAVLPFRSAGADEGGKRVADGLDDAVIDQLARLGDLRVLGREASQLVHSLKSAPNEPAPHNVRYFVEGSLTSQQTNATVSVRLLDGEQRQVVWSTRIPVTLSSDVATAQVEVAAIIARTLAQPYGAIYRMDASRSGEGSRMDAQASACETNFYRYRVSIAAGSNRVVRACLEETVKRAPHYATAWAMLSLVLLDDLRFGFIAGEPFAAIVKRAGDAAERAVELEPENIRALQAAMLARFFSGDIERGRDAGDRALEINPHDTEVLSEYGTRLAQTGEWARGARMLEAALAQDPLNAGVLHGHAALATLMDGRIDAAAAHLGKMKVDPHPSVLFIKMLVHAEAGEMNSARHAFASLKQIGSTFVTDLDKELGIRNIRGADLERIKAILNRVRTTTVAVHIE
jgi:adenylate cyclase